MSTTVVGLAFEERIGIGAMGEVWGARAPDGTGVAVKIARREARSDPRMLDLVAGEARTLATLDHPCIAWLYDHGRIPSGTPFPTGAPYLVLEHCGGGTLADRKVEDWASVRPILVALLQALAHAHAHGIVHRDLKPANVLWAGPTDVRPGMKLADFGVAYWIGASDRAVRVGTPAYMAPELSRRSSVAVGPWTDLYALGVVGWELVTGQPPFERPTAAASLQAALRGPPALVTRFDVPDGLEEWLAALLEPEPNRRVAQAAKALGDLAEIDPEVARPESGWESAPRVGPRLRLQGAGLALLALRPPELAGRREERAALWEALEQTRRDRTSRVAVLRGVSGIGKSRLCRWLAERVAEVGLAEPAIVACRELGTLPRLLAAMFGIEDSGPERLDAIRAAVEAHGRAAAERIHALLADPENPWGGVPVVHQLLRDEAAFRPRILVLDDAQECPEAIRLAASLCAEQVAAPLLVLVAVDDEVLGRDPSLESIVEGLCRSPEVQVLRLGGLSTQEQDELLHTLVGLDPESHSDLLARAGGHPGYLVAQVTSWARQGVLVAGSRGFRRAGRSDAEESWSSLWVRRLLDWLATLDPEDRVLLERAAVGGRAVDEALWSAACDDPEGSAGTERVQVHRGAARRRALLVERLITAGLAHDTDDGFQFTHPAVVDLLVERARAGGRFGEHHRACANQLQRTQGAEWVLQLGRHLAYAEQWEAAIPALLRGLRVAWSRQDRRPLLADIELTQLCADRAGWPVDDPRRWEIHHLRALLLLAAGRGEEAIREARRGWELAVETGVRVNVARTLIARIDLLSAARRLEEVAELVPQYLEVEGPDGEPHWPGIARVRYAKRLLDLGQKEGASRWFALAEEKLVGASDTGSYWVLAAMLELHSARRDNQRILELGPRTERAAADHGRTDVVVFAASMQTEAASRLGLYAQALEHGVRALRLNEQLGDARFVLFMRAQLAGIEGERGRYVEGIRWLDLVVQDSERVQNAWLMGSVYIQRADFQLRLGDLAAYDREVRELDTLLPRTLGAQASLIERVEAMVERLRAQEEWERAASLDALLLKSRRAVHPAVFG